MGEFICLKEHSNPGALESLNPFLAMPEKE